MKDFVIRALLNILCLAMFAFLGVLIAWRF